MSARHAQIVQKRFFEKPLDIFLKRLEMAGFTRPPSSREGPELPRKLAARAATAIERLLPLSSSGHNDKPALRGFMTRRSL